MALEIRPVHDPTREYGFLGVVVDTTNLEVLKGFGAVPLLISDIDL